MLRPVYSVSRDVPCLRRKEKRPGWLPIRAVSERVSRQEGSSGRNAGLGPVRTLVLDENARADDKPALHRAHHAAKERAMLFPLIRPALCALDAERAHQLTIAALAAWGGRGAGGPVTDSRLETSVAGRTFANPVGVAAGGDKDGRAIDGCFALGFG